MTDENTKPSNKRFGRTGNLPPPEPTQPSDPAVKEVSLGLIFKDGSGILPLPPGFGGSPRVGRRHAATTSAKDTPELGESPRTGDWHTATALAKDIPRTGCTTTWGTRLRHERKKMIGDVMLATGMNEEEATGIVSTHLIGVHRSKGGHVTMTASDDAKRSMLDKLKVIDDKKHGPASL